MYVIFPADEVVYLSYGRLIYVPSNPGADSAPPSRQQPIRTEVNPSEAQSAPSTTSGSTNDEPVLNARGSSEGQPAKRRPSRFNFNLLRRSKPPPEASGTPRVRYSVAPAVAVHTPPVEAFKKFCNISTPAVEASKQKEKSVERNLTSDSKRSSKQSSISSKIGKPPSVPEESDSKRSSKISSNSLPKQNSAESSNNSSLRRSKRSPNHVKVPRRPSTSREDVQNLNPQEEFYPLSTRRERTYTDPTTSTAKKSPKLSSNSFRLPFRKDRTPEVPPVPPDRRSKKLVKEKEKRGLERKLSYSDYLAVSREKTIDPVVSSSRQSDREKTPKKSDKSPVLRFFRRSASPKNLGVDRTPLEQGSPSKSRRARGRGHHQHQPSAQLA